MKNKTPVYTLNASAAWKKRKQKDGWKYFTVLAPVTIVERLKELYNELKGKI